jgi:hypothetical protein
MKSEKLIEMETLCGQRGEATFNSGGGGMQRDAVKKWLKDEGVPFHRYNSLRLSELHEVVNDTSDAILMALNGPEAAPAVLPEFAPAAPAPVADPANPFGMMEVAIEAVVDRKLDGFDPKGGVDKDEVEGIVEDVLASGKLKIDDGEVAKIAETVVDGKLGTIQPIIDALKTDSSVFTGKRAPVISAIAGGNKIMALLAPFYKAGTICKANVLLTSPPSFGKSHTIRKLGESYDLFLEHGCSNDMDEIATLLGNPTPNGEGGFTVFDGVLTQAVRAASEGQTVLFLMDEILRWPETVQEWLLTFLTGVKKTTGKVYQLRTRRVVDGDLEVVECPAENFHLVAATNLGMIRPVEAFWSRFLTRRVQWDAGTATVIGQSIMDTNGVTVASGKPKVLAAHFAKVMGESRNAMKEGRTSFPVDFRLLEIAAGCSPDDSEGGVAEFLSEFVTDQAALWDADSGDTLHESKALCEGWAKTLKALNPAK